MVSTRVPFSYVDAENAALAVQLGAAVDRHLRAGDFIGGSAVTTFESSMAELHRARFAVAVNSGADALRLVMQAHAPSVEDVGITVANTFIASAGAMVAAGVKPLLIDVGDDENMDVKALESAVTPQTRFVVAVHLRGLPARMRTIKDVCARHGIVLIEDCAQAVLATEYGVPVGTSGAAGCFSLHPLKNLGACGDGGLVVTDDEALADDLRLRRNHGLRDRDSAVRWGENSRLDAMQAAILNVKLKHLRQWTDRRRWIASRYNEALQETHLRLPVTRSEAEHVYHRYVIRTPYRRRFREHMAEHGVETAIHYPVPIHRQPIEMLSGMEVARSGLSRTEQQAGQILSLPLHPSMTDEQVTAVAEAVRRFRAPDDRGEARQ
jgi:dTDP-4-amino-4,6-dideoxygalactose transaminase